MFLDALTYPLRRGGWVMILIGALFSVLLDVFKLAPLVGLIVAIFSMGYFGAFYLDIVSTTMGGRDDVPDWPNFSNFWDDIMAPFGRLFALVLLSFGPLIALVFLADYKADWFVPAFWVALRMVAFISRWLSWRLRRSGMLGRRFRTLCGRASFVAFQATFWPPWVLRLRLLP